MDLRRKSYTTASFDESYSEIDEQIEGRIAYDILEKVATKSFSKARHVSERTGHKVNYGDFLKNGFDKPILVKDKLGLGVQVPSAESFTVDDVMEHVGEERIVGVTDAVTQSSETWEMKKWVHYYKMPRKRRKRTWNVISLEFSGTTLDPLVKSPTVVRELDWAQKAWPLDMMYHDSEQRDDGLTFPKVLKYCLMSVAGCYTDFHIDLGGTSVWYHILRGQKVFWLIPPTVENLNAYIEWSTSGEQERSFLADTCEGCQRVTLNAGNTFFIPTGWIHSVYTPVDSLVFGGNFLHSLNIGLQLRIVAIEERLKILDTYRYPFFHEMQWYVYDHYNIALTGVSHMTIDDKPVNKLVDIVASEPVLSKYELQGLRNLREWLPNQDPNTYPDNESSKQQLLESMMVAIAKHSSDDKKDPHPSQRSLLQWKPSVLFSADAFKAEAALDPRQTKLTDLYYKRSKPNKDQGEEKSKKCASFSRIPDGSDISSKDKARVANVTGTKKRKLEDQLSKSESPTKPAKPVSSQKTLTQFISVQPIRKSKRTPKKKSFENYDLSVRNHKSRKVDTIKHPELGLGQDMAADESPLYNSKCIEDMLKSAGTTRLNISGDVVLYKSKETGEYRVFQRAKRTSDIASPDHHTQPSVEDKSVCENTKIKTPPKHSPLKEFVSEDLTGAVIKVEKLDSSTVIMGAELVGDIQAYLVQAAVHAKQNTEKPKRRMVFLCLSQTVDDDNEMMYVGFVMAANVDCYLYNMSTKTSVKYVKIDLDNHNQQVRSVDLPLVFPKPRDLVKCQKLTEHRLFAREVPHPLLAAVEVESVYKSIHQGYDAKVSCQRALNGKSSMESVPGKTSKANSLTSILKVGPENQVMEEHTKKDSIAAATFKQLVASSGCTGNNSASKAILCPTDASIKSLTTIGGSAMDSRRVPAGSMNLAGKPGNAIVVTVVRSKSNQNVEQEQQIVEPKQTKLISFKGLDGKAIKLDEPNRERDLLFGLSDKSREHLIGSSVESGQTILGGKVADQGISNVVNISNLVCYDQNIIRCDAEESLVIVKNSLQSDVCNNTNSVKVVGEIPSIADDLTGDNLLATKDEVSVELPNDSTSERSLEHDSPRSSSDKNCTKQRSGSMLTDYFALTNKKSSIDPEPEKRGKAVGSTPHRSTACGECDSCVAKNCQHCTYCKDMKKYGGPGKLKQKCVRKRCRFMGKCSAKANCKPKTFDRKRKSKSYEADIISDSPSVVYFDANCESLEHIPITPKTQELTSDTSKKKDMPESLEKKTAYQVMIKNEASTVRKMPNCGTCVMCLDKFEFGGPNRKKQMCLQKKSILKQRIATLEQQDILNSDSDSPIKKHSGRTSSRRRKLTQKMEESMDQSWNENISQSIPELSDYGSSLLDSYLETLHDDRSSDSDEGADDSDSDEDREDTVSEEDDNFCGLQINDLMDEMDAMMSKEVSEPNLVKPVTHVPDTSAEGASLLLLPAGAIVSIFKYLPRSDLINCSLVCKSWNQASKDRSLWKSIDLTKRSIDQSVSNCVVRLQPEKLSLNKAITSKQALKTLLTGLSYCTDLSMKGVTAVAKLGLGSIPSTVTALNISGILGLNDGVFSTLLASPLLMIHSLDVSNTEISDQSLKSLSKLLLPDLVSLSVNSCSNITNSGIDHLVNSDTISLREIEMTDCEGIDSDCLKLITNSKGLPMLTSLNFNGCPNISLSDIRGFVNTEQGPETPWRYSRRHLLRDA